MNEKVRKALPIVGLVLHVLIAAMILMAGSGKAFGFAPEEMVSGMAKMGLGDQIKLIGFGEMIAALLMFVPQVRSLGVLATSGFWGGVIAIHMAFQQSIILPSVLLALTWVGAYLRGIVKLPG
jgi:hypothetical protein